MAMNFPPPLTAAVEGAVVDDGRSPDVPHIVIVVHDRDVLLVEEGVEQVEERKLGTFSGPVPVLVLEDFCVYVAAFLF